MKTRPDLVADDWADLTVVWGTGPWDGHRLGAQSLAEALSRRGPVLYIDPPRSVVGVARAGVSGLREELSRSRLSLVSPSLARLRVLVPPAHTRPGVRGLTRWSTARAVRAAVAELGGDVRAVISGHLNADPFGVCGERWRIFRCSDDFDTGAELGVAVRRASRVQASLAQAADAIVCVSPVLVDQWRARGYDPYLVANGCDERLGDAATLPRPDDVRLVRPIVGYVGLLSSRIDVDLLWSIATAGHSLLLIGERRPDLDGAKFRTLLDLPSVQWIGHRSYGELAAYLGSIDVGIVPYRDSRFNRASFPLKLLEYLAAGIAPVSTDLPAVRWLNTELVRVGRDHAEFLGAIDESLSEIGDEKCRSARIEFAGLHSWSNRAADHLEILDRLDETRGPLVAR